MEKKESCPLPGIEPLPCSLKLVAVLTKLSQLIACSYSKDKSRLGLNLSVLIQEKESLYEFVYVKLT
jgi:hypothetical protein